MSFFEHLMKLNELQVDGQQVDDNDDFDVEDDTPDTDETPEPTDAPTDTADAAVNNEENAPETTSDATDNEDDFTLDDNDEAMDNTEDDGAQEPDTADNADTGDTGGGDEDTNDDFSVDTTGNEDEGETSNTGDTTENAGENNTENKTPADPTDEVSDEEQRASEEQIYDSLTDDQKRIRVLQLKIDYKDLYETFNTTLDGIFNIPKTNDNLETLKRLSILLNKAKDILISYIQNNFDQNTYLENYTMYLKYMAVFRTTSKVIDELNNSKK